LSLQDINEERFAIAGLYGKFANTFADLKSYKLTTTGNFKMQVSGDFIRAQKKYGQPFDFPIYAKLIFSANEIPQSDDNKLAYYLRWIILLFEKVFDGEDKDSNLIDKLTTDAEFSGLLNLALVALRQLIKDHGFSATNFIFIPTLGMRTVSLTSSIHGETKYTKEPYCFIEIFYRYIYKNFCCH